MTPAIAYFVSPHGFGHAARSVAVMEALRALRPDTRIEIFTTVPAWFFEDSGLSPITLHPVLTDVGLVQTSSLEEDPAATARALADFLPFTDGRVTRLAETVEAAGCRLLVTDISPLGPAVAARAGIPGVLVESFTWDWIYRGYGVTSTASRLSPGFCLCSKSASTPPPSGSRPIPAANRLPKPPGSAR
ncbi:MAG: hypothetical protein EP299_04745 [Acidobacteria bacterium]|nr:MAG: hypothetical protein EP299_04745 [Acidobacteriota bacterium]